MLWNLNVKKGGKGEVRIQKDKAKSTNSKMANELVQQKVRKKVASVKYSRARTVRKEITSSVHC